MTSKCHQRKTITERQKQRHFETTLTISLPCNHNLPSLNLVLPPTFLVIHTVQWIHVLLDSFLGFGFLAPDLADVDDSADEAKEEKTS